MRRGARRTPAAMAALLLALAAIAGFAVSGFAAATAPRPVVSHISPTTGSSEGGSTVTITGRNFRSGGRNIVKQVRFGTKAATGLRVRSARMLTVSSPPGRGTVNVTVLTTAGKSAKSPTATYRYRIATQYVVTASSYEPAAGSSVTIKAQLADADGRPVAQRGVKVTWSKTGSGGAFSAAAGLTDACGVATVTFTTGTATTTHVVRATDTRSRTGISPPITITAGSDVSITGVSPASGPTVGGNTVTVEGSGLSEVTAVAFGARSASTVTVMSDTKLTVVAPAGPVGAVDVSVTAAGNTITLAKAYTYAVYTIKGVVKGYSALDENDNRTVQKLSGALVVVRIDAADPLYDAAADANNVLGAATTDSNGEYTISTASIRGAPLPFGTVVDVSAAHSGHLSVTQYGVYDRATVVVNYQTFISQGYGNRTLPCDDGGIPPLPFEHLMPNYLTSP